MSADERTGRRGSERVWLVLSGISIAAGVAMRLGALTAPLVADDFAQRAMLEGRYPVHRSPLDLYNFADGSANETLTLMNGGALPWWSDPHLKYAMLRPLSSALLWADSALFGSSSFAAHAHSLLWCALAAGAVAWLLHSVLSPRAAAIGTLLFALDEAHTWPVTWLANRNALVSATFGALALCAYARWRQQCLPRDAIWTLVGLTLSCLGGETGLCFAGYVVAYEVVVARGRVARRASGLLPAVVPFALYAVVYRALGRGAFGSDVYIDPVSEPASYWHAATPRMLALLSDLLVGTPAELWDEHGSVVPVLRVVLLAGLITVASVVLAARHLERRTVMHAAWLGFGAPLAVLPVLSSFVTARLLLPAEMGACAVFAVVIDGAVQSVRRRGKGGAIGFAAKGFAILAGAGIMFVHVGLAAYRSVHELYFWRRFYRDQEAAVAAAPLDRERLADSTVVLLTAVDPETLLYAPSVWRASGIPAPHRWRVLSMAFGPHVLSRTADDTLELSPIASELLTMRFEMLFRSSRHPMHVGDVVRLDGMTATVLIMGQVGPKIVRFQFDRSLDAPTMTLLVVVGGVLHRFRAPAIGDAAIIGPATVPGRALP